MTIRKMFSQQSLREIEKASFDTSLSDEEFSAFQQSHLHHHFSSFKYNSCTVSLIETDGNTGTENVESVLLGIDASLETVMASYLNTVEHDKLSALVYANPGKLFLNSDVFDPPFERHEIYKDHCLKFDVYNVYSIGFSQIAADEFIIAFDYMGNKNNSNWHDISPKELEYASFPFALAWLYRKKRVGRNQLIKHLKAIEGMTFRRLEKLRRFINRDPQESLEDQAKSLNLKLTGYDSALYDIRDSIKNKFPEDFKNSKSLKLEAIEPYCFLLSMMKNQTSPIVVPPNVQLTKSYFERTQSSSQ